MRTTLVLTMLISSAAYACINAKGVTMDGDYTMANGDPQVDFLRARMEATPASKLGLLDGGHSEPHDTRIRAMAYPEPPDVLPVRLILLGEYAAAIEKLEVMEAANPGEYSTAANLGTAYELSGDNQAALHWITESIARNDEAHYGTEWLHKAILEAKVAAESDPDYFTSHRILPVPEPAQWSPQYALEFDGETRDAETLIAALYYQLGERMLFVKPADPVVADLLHSLALLEAQTRILEPAIELLQLAKSYGHHDVAGIDARITRYNAILEDTWQIDSQIVFRRLLTLAFFAFIFLAIFIIARACYRDLRATVPGRTRH